MTILVASGLTRRPSQREIGLLVTPEFRRRFHGRLIVHDAESEELVEIGSVAGSGRRVTARSPTATSIVTVTAAESVLHGGAGRAARRGVARSSCAPAARPRSSRLGLPGLAARASSSNELLAKRPPLFGVSLVLNLPRVLRRLPLSTRTRSSGSPARSSVPASRSSPRPAQEDHRARARRAHRRRGLRRQPLDRPQRGAPARDRVQGRTDSTSRSTRSSIGIPPTTPFLPRERPNPISAAYLGLGLALRLWRNAFPVVARAERRFSSTTCARSRTHPDALPRALRATRAAPAIARLLAAASGGARRSARARGLSSRPDGASRSSRFAPGAPASRRVSQLGSVLIAGCRTRTPRASSASSRCTGSARRSRWRAAAEPGASASCSSPPYFPAARA